MLSVGMSLINGMEQFSFHNQVNKLQSFETYVFVFVFVLFIFFLCLFVWFNYIWTKILNITLKSCICEEVLLGAIQLTSIF